MAKLESFTSKFDFIGLYYLCDIGEDFKSIPVISFFKEKLEILIISTQRLFLDVHSNGHSNQFVYKAQTAKRK